MVYDDAMHSWMPYSIVVVILLVYAFFATRYWYRFYTYARRQGSVIASRTAPTQTQAEEHAKSMIQDLENSEVNDWRVAIYDAWTGQEIKSVHADQPGKALD